MGEADTLAASMAMLGQWVNRIRQRRPLNKLILDLNTSVSETCGRRELIVHNLRAKPVQAYAY